MYEPVDEHYEQARLDQAYDLPEKDAEPSTRSYHINVPVDSNVERTFVNKLDNRQDVRVFVNLPRWFTVPTPVGQYNPDWGLVIERKGTAEEPGATALYLVAETKGSTDKNELRGKEQQRIHCGRRHFEGALKGVVYKVVKDADEL